MWLKCKQNLYILANAIQAMCIANMDEHANIYPYFFSMSVSLQMTKITQDLSNPSVYWPLKAVTEQLAMTVKMHLFNNYF